MRIVLLLVLAFALAGCSDSGGNDGGPAATSTTSTTTGPPPKPVVTSDTLHLLAPPDMTLALAAGSSEISTPASAGFNGPGGGGGGGQQGEQARWSYVVTAPSNVTGAEARIWIEITETLLPSPFANPTQPSCTWILVLELGADGDAEVGCLTEPTGPINPGMKELVFTFVGLSAEMELNETISVEFHRTAFSASANNAVFVLSGSSDRDSRVKLNGFKDPILD